MDPGKRSLSRPLRGPLLAPLLCVIASGCGDSRAHGWPDADPFRPDASMASCTEPQATLGRCETPTGDDCTGVPDEETLFLPLEDGDTLRMVVGPQGSTMFVFALRASDIDPGDPDDPIGPNNPNITIVLLHGDGEVARYRGRRYLEPTESDPNVYSVTGLFVVVDEIATELVGLELSAVAHIEDPSGIMVCDDASFVASN